MPQPALRNSSSAANSGNGGLSEQLRQRTGVSQARPAAARARTGRLDFFRAGAADRLAGAGGMVPSTNYR